MSSNVSEISQLANILHENGDRVMSALSKLSLNAVLLQKLNKEFESLLENSTGSEKSFQVITPTHGNSQFLKDLQFLHDFIQKTKGLKLINNLNLALLHNKIDISKFKNIKHLEIKKIPVKEVVGLKNIQSQLESIVCLRCLSVLEELFGKCGGDNSNGVVWNELIKAILSFNNIKVVDLSIGLAPFLQVLDLSHNQITDVKAIECLPNLKCVNLSFNCLNSIPTFNKSARKTIELLVMKNNYIEDLSGLNGLTRLTELDMSTNWIASWKSLSSLLTISTLQWLSLAENPISCHSYYRQRVAGYLHISASFSDFYLDKLKLSKKEKAIVGIKLDDKTTLPSDSHRKRIPRDSSKKKSLSEENNTEEQTNNIRKSGKARLVVIPNLDDGTYEEEPLNYVNTLDLTGSSTEYLITKKRIENTRSTYGIDNWLVQGSSVVQDILGLPPPQVSTSTPYDNLCLEAALDSVKNVVTTVAIIETQQETQSDDLGKNFNSFTSCNEEDNTSNYFSAETSTEKDEIKKQDEEDLLEPVTSKEVSPEAEEIEIDENEKLFVVLKDTKTFNGEITQEEMFLTITESEFQERDANRGKICNKWCLSSIESCIKLKSNKLQIVFNTSRRDKRERIYSLEEQEAVILYKQVAEILESRKLCDMNQIVYKCESCGSQFSSEINSRKPDSSKWCPFCNSKFVLQVDDIFELTKEVERNISEPKNSKNSDGKISHVRSSSTAGFFQNFLNWREDKLLKCASQSSIEGSSASLDGLNDLPAIQNNSVKRSDSDIEILSNPSQTSIEVIDGPGSTPGQKRSYEESQEDIIPEALAAANLNQNNPPTVLLESSSSGSVTDSICTAYESGGAAANSNSNKMENGQVLAKESQEKKTKTEPILQEVLTNTRNIMKEAKEVDLIRYSFSDFTIIDHRIKLFLYTHVFDDSSEEFSFGIRAIISSINKDNNTNLFPSCIIVSSKNLYFLKVINSEEGYDARRFLQKVDSLCFNLSTVICIFTLTWYQGFGIKIKSSKNKIKQYLILLMNPARTQNFLNFLESTEWHGLRNAKIIKEAEQRPYWSIQHLLLSSPSLEDTNIQYFSLFNSASVTSNLGIKSIQFGGILANSTELILLGGNLKWLFGGAVDPPNLEHFQKFTNLVEVLTSQSVIIMQFFDGAKEAEVWSLFMEGTESAEGLINCLKESWEKIFSTPMQLCFF